MERSADVVTANTLPSGSPWKSHWINQKGALWAWGPGSVNGYGRHRTMVAEAPPSAPVLAASHSFPPVTFQFPFFQPNHPASH